MNPDLQLRDIHLPAEVGFWPPAPGWWLLMLVILVLLFVLLRWLQKRTNSVVPTRQSGPVIRRALQELDKIEQQHRQDPHTLVRELSVLLRRSAISLHGRKRISGLTGQDWLNYLDEQLSRPVMGERFSRSLTELPYQRQADSQATALLDAVRQWLKDQDKEQERRHV